MSLWPKNTIGKIGRALVLLGLLTSFLYSCSQPPVYPNAPKISFVSLAFQRDYVITRTGAGQINDTADYFFLTIAYQDGDGDLGLDGNDTTGPYIRYISNTDGSKKQNPDYFNFFPDMYEAYKGDTGFHAYVFPSAGLNFYGRFNRISSDSRSEPVKGTIEYKIRVTRHLLPKGRKYKFKLFIQDRALNKSNNIWTDVVTAG